MKVEAIRGVCIGVNRHLAAGDTTDLEPGLVTYLVGIGAVRVVKDEPPPPEPTPLAEPTEAKKADLQSESTPGKSGRKEK